MATPKPPTSWVPTVTPTTDFSLANLPFGIITTPSDPSPHAAVAIGTSVLDLKILSSHPAFPSLFPPLAAHPPIFSHPTLNAFAALGRPVHRQVRAALADLLSSDTAHPEVLRDADPAERDRVLLPQSKVTMHLPMEVGDYTDFYAGYHHAYRVGCLFRGEEKALQENYVHLPVGYHGRASSVVVSGTGIKRPVGQMMLEGGLTTGPSRRLDFELELGCFVGRGNRMGERVGVEEAEENIFGYVLLNDWSARDVQAWEYVPLGPFCGKNFGTTVGAWVVLADALEGFRTKGVQVEGRGEVQGYLREGREERVFDVRLEVDLTSKLVRLWWGRLDADIGGGDSARGGYYDDFEDQRQAPAVVVSADDCAPHARGVSDADGGPVGVGDD